MKETYDADLFGGEPMPDKLQIIVSVNRDNDEISVSKCIDPQFDLEILTEALASLIIIAGKYTEKSPKKVLEDINSKLKNAVLFHGKIERSDI